MKGGGGGLDPTLFLHSILIPSPPLSFISRVAGGCNRTIPIPILGILTGSARIHLSFWDIGTNHCNFHFVGFPRNVGGAGPSSSAGVPKEGPLGPKEGPGAQYKAALDRLKALAKETRGARSLFPLEASF